MTTEVKPAAEAARLALTAAIGNGVFGPGVRLPGERALAAQLSVSRETLRQALRQLADEGVLHPSPQRGWYVTTHMISDPPNVLQSFTDMAHARGLTPTTRVLASTQRPATLDEAERLAVAPASPVLDLRRLRSLDGIPFSVDHTVVALGRAPGLAEVDFTDASLYATLEDTCGVRLAHSSYSVSAHAADASTAELLRLDPGAPVLVGEEVTYDLADVPILRGRIIYRGDAYEFQATLYRQT
jgi:GntR family transcriptional regulator